MGGRVTILTLVENMGDVIWIEGTQDLLALYNWHIKVEWISVG